VTELKLPSLGICSNGELPAQLSYERSVNGAQRSHSQQGYNESQGRGPLGAHVQYILHSK